LRFQQPGRASGSVLSAHVELDRNLKVVGEGFGKGTASSGSAGQRSAPQD